LPKLRKLPPIYWLNYQRLFNHRLRLRVHLLLLGLLDLPVYPVRIPIICLLLIPNNQYREIPVRQPFCLQAELLREVPIICR
jgi:hypothetical protein